MRRLGCSRLSGPQRLHLLRCRPAPSFPRRLYTPIRAQLVLVRGDFSGHLRKADAAHLLTLMRYYYFSEPGAVETFNLDPRAFDWPAFLAAVPKPPPLIAADDAAAGSSSP